MLLCDWLPLLSVTSERFAHVVAASLGGFPFSSHLLEGVQPELLGGLLLCFSASVALWSPVPSPSFSSFPSSVWSPCSLTLSVTFSFWGLHSPWLLSVLPLLLKMLR